MAEAPGGELMGYSESGARAAALGNVRGAGDRREPGAVVSGPVLSTCRCRHQEL